MLVIPQRFGGLVIPKSRGAAKTITGTDSQHDSADRTTYTFTDVNFGDPAADRYILVGTTLINTGTTARILDSATIGGVDATKVAEQRNTAAGGSRVCAFAIAHVPTGKTGTVTVTWNAGSQATSILVWQVTGISSPTPTRTFGDTGLDPMGLNINTTAGDIVVAMTREANGDFNHTWTGLTKNFDISTASGASVIAEMDETPRSISCDLSTNSFAVGLCATWS